MDCSILFISLITISKSLSQVFPSGLAVKNLSAYNAGDEGSIPGSYRSPGEGNDNPLQYSCLGNPMDRGTWWATVRGIAKELDVTQQLNNSILVPTSISSLVKLGSHYLPHGGAVVIK